jgi:hypothetical protein
MQPSTVTAILSRQSQGMCVAGSKGADSLAMGASRGGQSLSCTSSSARPVGEKETQGWGGLGNGGEGGCAAQKCMLAM